MTPNELKNTIGVTKTIQMVSDALGLKYHPDSDDAFERCINNEERDSTKCYVAFWYNPNSGFRLKLNISVYYVDYVEIDAIIDYVQSFLRFNKALQASEMAKDITKDF